MRTLHIHFVWTYICTRIENNTLLHHKPLLVCIHLHSSAQVHVDIGHMLWLLCPLHMFQLCNRLNSRFHRPVKQFRTITNPHPISTCKFYTTEIFLPAFLQHLFKYKHYLIVNTFLGGVRNVQSGWDETGVFETGVVMVDGVDGEVVVIHGLLFFSTLHARLQYAVKHQPSPSVLLYIKLPT